MTLDEELRAALNQQADFQVVGRPDVHRLIVGGQVRRRRRTRSRIGGAALAVVLLGGGVYAVTQDGGETRGSRIAVDPTPTPEPPEAGVPPALPGDGGTGDLEPGTYRVIVGFDATGRALRADLTVEGAGWWSGDFPVVHEDDVYGGFGVYQPFALAAGDGCVDGAVNEDVARSPQSLAQQLAKLPSSTVVQPVTRAEMLGREAFHLRLRIRQSCGDKESDYYQVAHTARGSRGVTYGLVLSTVVIDFWVLDVDGVPVVVDRWHDEDAHIDLVDRIAQASESITFVPRS